MKLNHNPRVAYLIKDITGHFSLVHCASRTNLLSCDGLDEVFTYLMGKSQQRGHNIGTWDEGCEEYLTPLALLCSWVPDQQEYDAITGVYYDADGREEGSSEWCGLVSRILCPKAITPPRDTGPELHKLSAKSRTERHRILRLLDSINHRICGQPQLTGIMEAK
jgi:hypothetical protein